MISRTGKQLTAMLLLFNMLTAVRANDIEDVFKALRGGTNRRPPQVAQIPVGHDRGRGYSGDHSGYGYPGRQIHPHGPGMHSAMSSRDIAQRQQLARQFSGMRGDGFRGYHDDHYDLRDRYNDGRHHQSGYRGAGYGGAGYGSPRHGDSGYHAHSQAISSRRRSGSIVSFSVSSNAPVFYENGLNDLNDPVYGPTLVPQYPVVPAVPSAPAHSQTLPCPHQLGEIVTYAVPVATCIQIEDPENIAPHAVPVVVAVRDPNLGAIHTCVEQVVYVEVCVPPCPMRRLTVSPCRTRIRMDFGEYEVDIRSHRGKVVIDYDN